MPGLDYLGTPYDPREGQYSQSILAPLVFEAGVLGVGKWGLDKYIKNRGAAYTKALGKELTSGPSQYYHTAARSVAKKATLTELGTDFKQLKSLSSSMGMASKVFGYFGIGLLGYQATKMLLTTSRSFAMGTEELNQARYQNLYNGGDEYFDSRAAMTQRQRALQIIHNSQMSTRASFGSESGYLHY